MLDDKDTNKEEKERKDREESIVRRDHEMYTTFESRVQSYIGKKPEDYDDERLFTVASLFARECNVRSENDHDDMTVDHKDFKYNYPPEAYLYLHRLLESDKKVGSYYFRIFHSYLRMTYDLPKPSKNEFEKNGKANQKVEQNKPDENERVLTNYEVKGVITRALLLKSLGTERLGSFDDEEIDSIVDIDGLIDTEKFLLQYGDRLNEGDIKSIDFNLREEYGKSGLTYLQNNDFGREDYYVYGVDEPDTYYVGIDLSLPISVITKMIEQYKKDVRGKKALGDDTILNKKSFKRSEFVLFIESLQKNKRPMELQDKLADWLFIYDASQIGMKPKDICDQIDGYLQTKITNENNQPQMQLSTCKTYLERMTRIIEGHLYRELQD